MHRSCVRFLTLLGAASSSLAGVTVQKPGLTVPPEYASHKADVEKIFTTSYAAYKEFAFGHDELHPVSEGVGDDLGGWGASLVDAMGTMAVMGLDDLLEEAVNFTATIDFNTPPVPQLISVFETTIRWVGGLISAYELSGDKYPILITKAKEVTDKLAFAWVGGEFVHPYPSNATRDNVVQNNTMPYHSLNFTTNTPQIGTNSIAGVGTLSLEWLALSHYTGNETYGKLTEGGVIAVTQLPAPLPGLAGQNVDPGTGQFTNLYVTWGAGSDSYFEYLIKYARYTNNADMIFVDTWKTAVDSSIRTLLRNSTVGGHMYLADYDAQQLIRHVGSHLACYYAGNWLLGGKLLQNQTIIDIALQLNDGCWNTYASTEYTYLYNGLPSLTRNGLIRRTGIGPETFAFISSDGNFTGGSPITDDQLAFYNEHGFYITTSDYIQRPEYLDRAVSAIASFNKFLPSTVAFACLNNVNDITQGFINDMESFWFAEVLKYLYLTFDDPTHISLDTHVWNTECHPLKAPPALDSY
ncbi:alpha-1,2-Mannosidase [Mycena sanguinolenta]|uniref:alpha-1,2-Mannosidase n=1 Tax=Mycena sanguinolenta TaxID=230812 RepID=A0A8H6Z0M6_9AGAR|nr:alpha-1,2-Mannosidase [Mycena sanguinolenta]